MSLETFERLNFHPKPLTIIEQANTIIREYQAQEFVLTLRQIYYQFVARGLIDNRQSEYKRLGTIIRNARRAWLIDWDAIEDRTRNLRHSVSWASPSRIVSAAAAQYQGDLWRGQADRIEVWIEKDALLGVIEDVCEEFRLPYFSCRGNVSDSEIYSAAKRFQRHFGIGKTPLIVHLGDHDPSGLDMSRDIRDRLTLFAGQPIEVRRLALNIDQIDRYVPPPNPAKESDSRYAAYTKAYGAECWELDALDPTVIAELIRVEVQSLIDVAAWDSALAEEAENRALLDKASDNWALVENMLTEGGR
jgi:hypothetical protein